MNGAPVANKRQTITTRKSLILETSEVAASTWNLSFRLHCNDEEKSRLIVVETSKFVASTWNLTFRTKVLRVAKFEVEVFEKAFISVKKTLTSLLFTVDQKFHFLESIQSSP
jgi:hypothetical protein